MSAFNKLKDLNIMAFYAKKRYEKAEFINRIIQYKKEKDIIDQVVYFCPKKFISDVERTLKHKTYIFAYEDIQKNNQPFTVASDRSLLVLDDCSRYKNILSYVFARLAKLALYYKQKVLLDIMPFTVDIQYLYIPWSYLDRSILGHQHYYAFRENYLETTADGNLIRGHDYNHLANKIKTYSAIAYGSFFENEISVINSQLTREEKNEYQTYRDKLFAEKSNPQPIITRLADFTNMCESRYQKLESLINQFTSKTIVYTNIKSHNGTLKKRFKGLDVRTYYDTNGDEASASNIVLFEVPIVKNYLFLDIIANLNPDCKVWIFTSDAPVDKYLFKKMNDEYTKINEFTRILKGVMEE